MSLKVNNPLDFKVLETDTARLEIKVGGSYYCVEAKRGSGKTELLLEEGLANDAVTLESVSIDNKLAVDFHRLNKLNALRYFCICGLTECSLIDAKDFENAYIEKMGVLEKVEMDTLLDAMDTFYKAKAQLEYMWRNRVKGCTLDGHIASSFKYELPNGDVLKRLVLWEDADKIDNFYVGMSKHIGLDPVRFKLGRRIAGINMDDFLMIPGFSYNKLDKDELAGVIESILTNNFEAHRTFLNHMAKLKDAYYEIQRIKNKKEKCFNAYILGYCDLD